MVKGWQESLKSPREHLGNRSYSNMAKQSVDIVVRTFSRIAATEGFKAVRDGERDLYAIQQFGDRYRVTDAKGELVFDVSDREVMAWGKLHSMILATKITQGDASAAEALDAWRQDQEAIAAKNELSAAVKRIKKLGAAFSADELAQLLKG